jgi:glutathione S-transferase
LVDGDFVTNESRAAAAYLVNKYGGDRKNELYPESPEDRARVDQRLYFDMGTFYKAFGECVVSIIALSNSYYSVKSFIVSLSSK